jgi:hypothetical protein
MKKFDILILLILFIYLTSFSLVNNKLYKGYMSEQIYNKDTLILGEWAIYKRVINEATVTCYSCPRILFLKDGTGKIKTPTNHEYKFKYTLIEDKLLFNSKTQKLSALLCKNTEFHYEIKDKGGSLDLILSSKKNDCKLVLSKKSNLAR